MAERETMAYIELGQHSISFVEFKVFQNNEQCGTIYYFYDMEKNNTEVMHTGEMPELIKTHNYYINDIAKKVMKANIISKKY